MLGMYLDVRTETGKKNTKNSEVSLKMKNLNFLEG